jgi:hypothetical protein
VNGADDRAGVVYAEHPESVEVVAWKARRDAQVSEHAFRPFRERNRPVRVGYSAGDHTVVTQGLAARVRERDEREWGYIVPFSCKT